jgi:hypothetical protein
MDRGDNKNAAHINYVVAARDDADGARKVLFQLILIRIVEFFFFFFPTRRHFCSFCLLVFTLYVCCLFKAYSMGDFELAHELHSRAAKVKFCV